ncbi:hypothetical protein PVAND_010386 [Polypedilum vanderplanki]|uniref:Phosphatidylinositol-glycan biosynthesis class F protein n=1 Tax=Polypedilum vanderplanki TaxID=319348 RepID=A0A9J6CFR8_POLVA|nr:hypothetical protein PVAND_010386 [Polypedilum vanderplanki]
MYSISILERIKLNYSMTTIGVIIVYTFFIQFVPEILWLTVLFFILAECFKVSIIQKLYSLDTANNTDGNSRKRRGNKVAESAKFGLLMILTVFFFAFICIILGAPAFENYEKTLTLSSLLTSLTLFPISLIVGVSGTISILLTDSFELVNVTSQAFLRLLKRNAYLVIFGAFIGSVVFPLDWDRPWQIYPIPNIVGAITGQMIGAFYTLFETMVNHKLGKKQH